MENNKQPEQPNQSTIQNYQEIVEFARRQVEWVHNAYMRYIRWIGSIIFVSVAAFTFVYCTNVKEMKDDLREKAKTMETDLGNKVDELSQKVEATINEELDKSSVQNMIEQKIKEKIDATQEDIIKNIVIAETEPLLSDIKIQIAALENQLTEQVKKVREVAVLNDLAIRATNGNKEAFMKLNSFPKDSQYYNTAETLVATVYDTFLSKKAFLNEKFYNASTPDNIVIKRLSSDHFLERKYAVTTILKRKMYNQIPTLIEMIRLEPSLDVLATIGRTLNDLLGTNINIIDKAAQEDFTKAWRSKKQELLKLESTN